MIHKPPHHTAPTQNVYNGQQAHAEVVRHVGAHRQISTALRYARMRHIQCLKEAVCARHFQRFIPPEIGRRTARIHQQRQIRRIGRQYRFAVQSALQTQRLHAVRLILIVHLRVKGKKAALRNAVGHFLRCALFLAVKRKALAFIKQRIRIAFQQQRRHQILKHRAGPGGQAAVTVQPHHLPAKPVPMAHLHFPARHGNIGGQARLARQKIIVPLARPVMLHIPAQTEKVPFRIIKRRQTHFPCKLSDTRRKALRALLPQLQKSLLQRNQAGGEIARIDRRHAARNHRQRVGGSIPVIEVAVPFFHAFQGGSRQFQTF